MASPEPFMEPCLKLAFPGTCDYIDKRVTSFWSWAVKVGLSACLCFAAHTEQSLCPEVCILKEVSFNLPTHP